MNAHPAWCEPSRCSVGHATGFKGLHRSAAIRGEYDRHSGNSVEASLWAFPDGDVYVQLEFPGSLREGIELTPSQGLDLSLTLKHLLATVEPEQFNPDDLPGITTFPPVVAMSRWIAARRRPD